MRPDFIVPPGAPAMTPAQAVLAACANVPAPPPADAPMDIDVRLRVQGAMWDDRLTRLERSIRAERAAWEALRGEMREARP